MKKKLKLILKKNKYVLMCFSYIYNIPFVIRNFRMIIKNDIQFSGSFLKNVKLNIVGSNNCIKISSLSRIYDSEINIFGNKCNIFIGNECIIKKSNLWLEDFSSKIKIGNYTTFESVHIAALENNKSVFIGEDCMFSRGIEIRTGDSHAIVSQISKTKINIGQDVYIGNHVWIGANATILKGVNISDNSVIGIGSIVTNNVESNSVVAGVPAKEISRDIYWTRDNLVEYIL